MKREISIVGAGPAGLMAAIKLSESGYSVTLFDPRVPWDKPCGGMIAARVLEEFPLFREFLNRTKACHQIYFESPSNDQKSTKVNKTLYIVSRREFSEFLIKKTEHLDIKWIREKVRTIHKKNSEYILSADVNQYVCSLLIGADGVSSVVRRLFLGKIEKKQLGLSCGYLTGSQKDNRFLIKYLDLEGYVWIFPGPNHTSIGIYDRMGEYTGKELFKKLDTFLLENGYHFDLNTRWRGILPMINDPVFYDNPCSGSDWMLIGDAAGHVDPLNGEGIYYALKSADLAVTAAKMDDFPKYDSLWKQSYGEKLVKHACHMKKIGEFKQSVGKKMVGEVMFNNAVYNP